MPSSPPTKVKAQLRRRFSALRRGISREQRAAASERICAHIFDSSVYKRAIHVAAYWALREEVDLHTLALNAAQAGKQLWLPRVQAGRMAFAAFESAADLERAPVGTLQPPPVAVTRQADRLDLVLLPLLAFSRSGRRLGMGGGYYDRAFSFMLQPRPLTGPLLVGVAFSEQEARHLPCDPWDVPLKHVATELEWIDCG